MPSSCQGGNHYWPKWTRVMGNEMIWPKHSPCVPNCLILPQTRVTTRWLRVLWGERKPPPLAWPVPSGSAGRYRAESEPHSGRREVVVECTHVQSWDPSCILLCLYRYDTSCTVLYSNECCTLHTAEKVYSDQLEINIDHHHQLLLLLWLINPFSYFFIEAVRREKI